ncbi:MAG: LIM domain-containing protein [Candidatus Thermoplasmatota archaeon]|jgi:hypothetical protein|nr:LIM domain-containing protein [Candidatus Thermoplasmatota archaeon]
MGSDRCMAEGIKEIRCDVCGLEIEDGKVILKNGKSYHSRCFKGLMEQERESRRNALKVIGIGTGYSVANVNLLEIGKYTYAGVNGGGISGAWALTPSTTSIPPSGTATANVNPYSVTGYLDGGSVTRVSMTRSGAEYILFDSAAGISMSGQGFKLVPGDTLYPHLWSSSNMGVDDVTTWSSLQEWVLIDERNTGI